MIRLLEFLTGFYWILIPQFILESLFRTCWRDTYHTGGALGLFSQGISAVFGLNSVAFYVDIDGTWSGYRIKRLLASYDIPIWGWGFAYGQFYFRVATEDAEFAEYLMLTAGVESCNYTGATIDWYHL